MQLVLLALGFCVCVCVRARVYVCDYFLFLQEQIEDIIIINLTSQRVPCEMDTESPHPMIAKPPAVMSPRHAR
jgi:hypothetical protein